MNFGPFELIIILAIVLLLFGTKRLKNIGSDLGGAIKGFKKSVKDSKNNNSESISADNPEKVVDVDVTPVDKKVH